MADQNKLWFEMGVRDKVSEQMRKIIKEAAGATEVINTARDAVEELGDVSDEEAKHIQKLAKEQANSRKVVLAALKAKKLEATLRKEAARAAKEEMLADRAVELAKKASSQASRDAAKANAELVRSYDQVVTSGNKAKSLLSQLTQQIGSYVSLLGAERLLKNIIQIGGEFEVQHIALQSILGDVQQANSMFEQMKELAVVSPFNFRQLAGYSKQIAAFGIPYEEMFDTTKRLADMAAGLGVDMGRLILAYGQVRSASVLRGQELRQFTEAGIPMVQALADEFTRLNGTATSTAEVFDLIRKRAVPFEMVKKVMWDMTDEGGRFFDMQYTLADTLKGKWSNLQDAWEILLSGFAEGTSLTGKMLKGMVTGVTRLIESFDRLTPILAGGGLFFGLKRMLGGLTFNNNKIGWDFGLERRVAQSQRLRAIEIERAVLEGRITKEEAQQARLLNNNLSNHYRLLALEGKINGFQIKRLITQKKINVENIEERLTRGQITKEEAAQLRLLRMKYKEKSYGDLLGGMLKGMVNVRSIASLAISAVTIGLMSWYSHVQKVKAANEEMMKNFSDKAREVKQSLDSLKDVSGLSEDGIKSSIEGLEEMVKQHSLNYDAIMLELRGVEDLTEQYRILRNALETTEVANERAAELKPSSKMRKSIKRAAGLDLTSGASLGAFEVEARRVAYLIGNIIGDVGIDEVATETARQFLRSLEEEAGMSDKKRYQFESMVFSNWGINVAEQWASEVERQFSNKISDLSKDFPELISKLKYAPKGAKLEDVLGLDEEKAVDEFVRNIVSDLSDRYKGIEDGLQDLLDNSDFVAHIALTFGANAKASDLAKSIFGMEGLTFDQRSMLAGLVHEKGSLSDAKKEIKKTYDELKEEIKDRTSLGLPTSDVQSQLDIYDPIRQMLGIGKDGKSNSQTDALLTEVKNRVALYKKFFSELEKMTQLYGQAGALRRMQEDGEFATIFGWGDVADVTDFAGTLDVLTRSLDRSTEARRSFLDQTGADRQAQIRKEEEEGIKAVTDALKEELNLLDKQYDSYKKLIELTGDRGLAARLALGGNISYGSTLDAMKARLRSELGGSDSLLADVLGMSSSEVNKMYGKSSVIGELYEAIKKEQMKVSEEALRLTTELIKANVSLEQQIAAENEQYKRQRELIIGQGGDDTDTLLGWLDEEYAERLSKLQFEQFKRTEDWGRVFADLDKVSTATLQDMLEKLRLLAPTLSLSAEETKTLYDAMEKIEDKLHQRSPLTAIVGGARNASRLRQLVGGLNGASFTPSASSASYYGLRQGKTYTTRELLDLIRGNENEFAEGVKGLSSMFGELQNVLSPVVELFEALGDNTMSDIMGGISNAFGAASSVAGGLEALNLGSLGPYGAAAGAALSIVTSLITAHEKAVQREIEASVERRKMLDSISNSLEKSLESTLGGIYSMKASQTERDLLHNMVYTKGEKGHYYWGVEGRWSYISEDTERAYKAAVDSDFGYFETQYAILLAKLDEATHQYALKATKENLLAVEEARAAVNNFAVELADTLYSIDFKSWASELGESLFEAWQKGEDGAKAFKETTEQLIASVAKNMVISKMVETALAPFTDSLTEMMKKNGGRLTPELVAELGGSIVDMIADISGDTISFLDRMEEEANRRGFSIKENDTSNSGTNAIKSITEDQANLLLSYVNAMRADLSIHVERFRQMLDGVMPDLSSHFALQLAELKRIESNTMRSADNTGHIMELLDSVSRGVKKLGVRIYTNA